MLSPIPGEKDSVEGILSLGGDKKCKAKDAGTYILFGASFPFKFITYICTLKKPL
jgi:hypothetical protein